MRVLRPCDADETTQCWRVALENTQTPSALILSRQNIESLPEPTNFEKVSRGAYVVREAQNPDVVMIASGSEVETLLHTAQLLETEDHIQARVISCPSEGLFRRQDTAYQKALLPEDVRRFGLTAGLPVTLLGLVGTSGRIFGMKSFGFSAPYKVLDEKLGFTPQNIQKEVKSFLK